MNNLKYLEVDKSIILENGLILQSPTIAYHTYGTLNEGKSNVVWVCHALTANSDVFDWWRGLFGEDDLFNPKGHFIVCANILGSHYGTTGPLSVKPDSGQPYYHDFPEVTIRDMVALHIELANHLKVKTIELLIGGSMGGHQALEWAIIEPDRIKNLCAIATSAIISPWAAALNASQRMAIEVDPTWPNSSDNAGIEGMKVARSMALLSYRNYGTYNNSQQQDSKDDTYQTKAASYQAYQGLKLSKRFNAFSYWHIAKAMDSQNVGRKRGSVESALSVISARTLVISIEGDLLFPYQDQKLISDNIIGAEIINVKSQYGHDGFLLETKQIGDALRYFMEGASVVQ
jgi:homoserine O-acetyltransferase/O-succinyltransferase